MTVLDFDNPHIDHPALTAFAELADRFCQLIEARGSRMRMDLIHQLHGLLPVLYGAGLRLPSTDVLFSDDGDDDDDPGYSRPPPDPDHPTSDEWAALNRELSSLFEPHNFYREVFDPYKPPEEEVEVLGSLSDDVADIYGDLVTGLRKWQRGETGHALWEWRFGLEHHWGEHATGAIRALHTRATWWDTWFPSPGAL